MKESLEDLFVWPDDTSYTREEVLNGEASHKSDDFIIIPVDHPDYITYLFF